MTKRDKILQAAIECFTNFGYEKTTMSDIGKRVGLNKASLYYHYKDKLALYNAVVEKIRSKYYSEWMIERDQLNPGIEKIISYINLEIRFIEELAIGLWSSTGVDYVESDKNIIMTSVMEEYTNNLTELLDEFHNGSNRELASQIILVVRGVILVDCPMDMPVNRRSAQYTLVRKQLSSIITLMLKGLK